MANMESGEEAHCDERPVVFFDGECGLCNGFVNFAMARDPRGRLTFAPLQGETAKDRLPASDRGLDTVVFLDDGGTRERSTAVIAALRRLGGVWPAVAAVLAVIPRPVRDLGYRVVAANRFRVFGRRDTCRTPTPEERGRLLP